jgi:hypothetical protein
MSEEEDTDHETAGMEGVGSLLCQRRLAGFMLVGMSGVGVNRRSTDGSGCQISAEEVW